MAGSGDRDAAAAWGTREDLLLASAVRLHGAGHWDAIAAEVRDRTPALLAITPERCEQRFRHLQRHFAEEDGGDGGGPEAGEGEEFAWVEKVRQLHIAQLRRELERSDASIMALQLKVKRLKDEQEASRRTAGGGVASDLNTERGNAAGSEGIRRGNRESDGNLSWNESNSTDPKVETEEEKKGTDSELAAADEKSCNASSEARAAAEAKGGRESSDVQSSASLPRRPRGRRSKPVLGGGEEPATKKRVEVKSRPLMAVLEIIRASEHGSVFERRLHSQESVRYRLLIRRHVDLEMVRSKVEAGAAYSASELFRDLLLLCVNAVVFYPERSPESRAAVHLHRLITREMANALPNRSQPSIKQQGPAPTLPVVIKDKPSVERSRITPLPQLVACRKRSSTTANNVGRVVKEEEEGEEKPRAGVKGRERSSITSKASVRVVEEEEEEEEERAEIPARKKAKERPSVVTGLKGLRSSKNSRVGGGSDVGKGPTRLEGSRPGKVLDKKTDKSNNSSSSGGRRGSAAELLSRMKEEAGRAVGEQKKEKKKGGNQNQQGVRQSYKGGPPLKRGVGRPPKREVAPSPPVKKRKEEEEVEDPPPRKRGRSRR